MARKEPLFGIAELSLHGAFRSREEWLKGREQHEMAEIDLSAQSKDGRHMGLIIDFTARVIGLAYEVTDAGADDAVDAPMKAPHVDWRTVHPPKGTDTDEHRRIWEEAQAQAKADAEKSPESAQA